MTGAGDPHAPQGPQQWGPPQQPAAGQWAQQPPWAQQQWTQPAPPYGQPQQWVSPPPAKSSSTPLVLVAIALVALLAGGLWFLTRPSASAQAEPVTASLPVQTAAAKSTPKPAPKATPVPTVTKVIERTVPRDDPAPRQRVSGPGAKNCSSNSGWGAYSGVNVAHSGTTCGFARNVRADYVNSGYSPNFMSYSPTTGKTYWMQCSRSSYVTCTGGNSAVIYIGNW